MKYIIATRPWSFTATVIPVLITAAIISREGGQKVVLQDVLRVLFIIISVHAGANLTNTYYDFVNGVDNEKTSGDRALVDK